MFTPLKNFITYIQKNASGGNSLFGGSNTNAPPGIKRKETENTKLQDANVLIDLTKMKEQQSNSLQNGSANAKETLKTPPKAVKARIAAPSSPVPRTVCAMGIGKTLPAKSASPRKQNASASTTPSSTTTNAPILIDDDDIETQIETSIMLKKPVRHARTNGTEILEVKKSPRSMGRSVYISHDYNRNHTVTSPIADELQDFRYDPTEVVVDPSSPLRQQPEEDRDDCYLVEEEENSPEGDSVTEDISIIENGVGECIEVEDCEDGDDGGDVGAVVVEDDNDDVEITENNPRSPSAENVIYIEPESDSSRNLSSRIEEEFEMEEVHEDEAEGTFLELNNFPDCEVIVINETDNERNVTPCPLEASISDDPLAIACDEHDAFVADRSAALEELNLLNSSNNSQDEDTRTTADDDVQWLREDTSMTEEHTYQPSCSKSPVIIDLISSEVTPEKDERNGEGSDSGLGSETSALHTTNTSLSGDTSHLNMSVPDSAGAPAHTSTTSTTQTLRKCGDKDKPLSSKLQELNKNKSPMKVSPKPLRSNLKRRLEVDEEVVVGSTSSLANASSNSISGSVQKKPKRSINFDSVQIFYFPRQQGFGCVPSAGGCTLGMGPRHVAFKTMTLAEHAAELRRAHRMQLQEINPRGSSSDDSEESEEDYLSEGSGSDLDGESNGFLQPVSPKQRRAILKVAGVRKIDTSEKVECRDIRNSREVCGCSCRDFCDPETCACSLSGIKCQVDRDMFPCGCNRDACGNTIGRVEFNPGRVRTHFIHTLMLLEMENRQQQNSYAPAVGVPSAATVATTGTSFYQSTHLQPQSNYSSGYASPAYNTPAGAELLPQSAVNTSFYHQTTTPISASLYGNGSGGVAAGIVDANSATTHVASVSGSTAPDVLDTLDSGLFGSGGAVAAPSYGELMPVSSYHHNVNYGNVATQQVPTYNPYHHPSYMNPVAETTTITNTPTTYSSCAVPSLPPYGTATTTEATGDYHIVNSLRTLETTTAPSCAAVAATSTAETVNADGEVTSFISLSTPVASSSRLSQINDLLQHNRNATTALVAVSQSADVPTTALPALSCELIETNCHANNGVGGTIATPTIRDSHNSSMTYVDLTEPTPIETFVENTRVAQSAASSLPLNPPIPTIDLTTTQTASTPTVLSPTRTEILTTMMDKTPTTMSSPPSSSSARPALSEVIDLSATPSFNSEPLSGPLSTAIAPPPAVVDKEALVAPTPIAVASDAAVIEVAAGN